MLRCWSACTAVKLLDATIKCGLETVLVDHTGTYSDGRVHASNPSSHNQNSITEWLADLSRFRRSLCWLDGSKVVDGGAR